MVQSKVEFCVLLLSYKLATGLTALSWARKHFACANLRFRSLTIIGARPHSLSTGAIYPIPAWYLLWL